MMLSWSAHRSDGGREVWIEVGIFVVRRLGNRLSCRVAWRVSAGCLEKNRGFFGIAPVRLVLFKSAF